MQDVKSPLLLPQLYLTLGILLVSWWQGLLFLLESGEFSLPIALFFG